MSFQHHLNKQQTDIVLFALEFLQMHKDTSESMSQKASSVKELIGSLRGAEGGIIIDAD